MVNYVKTVERMTVDTHVVALVRIADHLALLPSHQRESLVFISDLRVASHKVITTIWLCFAVTPVIRYGATIPYVITEYTLNFY